jgi:fructokinase
MRSSRGKPLVGVGELLWDLLPDGPRLGGTTTNFAILSARLGEWVELVSRVGGDRLGHEAMERLHGVVGAAAERFGLTHVQQADDLATGTVSVTLNSHGQPQYNIHEPVAWDGLTLSDELLELGGRASAICFGTLAQREPRSRETIRAFVEASAAECVRVCDVNLRMPFCSAEVLRWCLQQATVLKVSDEELAEVGTLLGDERIGLGAARSGASLTEAAALAAQALLTHAPQCRLVAITLGAHGSLLADRESVSRHEGFKVQVADTIGAGDAFTAGLVHAYVRGAALEQINTVSNLCGSYVASQKGATPELPEALVAKIAAELG